MTEKPVIWVGSSRERLRAFPVDARRDAGHQLHVVQLGLPPSDWRPMPSVGAGVVELRVHAAGEHRVVYVAKFAEALYVLHAFEKKTRQTREADLDLARRNLAAVLQQRRAR
ncbi:MAG TPA: type II toxin-antitoxin system RelE/ParE family toxin [Steroidobacteraceae bacterium]|nr:type II toxin-antitoxin system RelE/ParE family toxin [Steroidobacteraceae bacterium]